MFVKDVTQRVEVVQEVVSVADRREFTTSICCGDMLVLSSVNCGQ